MHACELVEFAGLLATNGPLIIRHSERLSNSGLEQYWTASKCRQESWSRTLNRFSRQVQYANSNEVAAAWQEIRPLLDEILTTEILTRVWTAVCCGFEQRRGLDEASPVVRNVLAGHLESRHRVLNLMVYGHGLRVEEAVELNRMRRRNERWTDVLLGQLAETTKVSEFACSANRVHEFAADMRNAHRPETAWSLLLTSLRTSYRRTQGDAAHSDEFNHRIVAGILACLPSELFDTTGMLKSLWVVRMQHAARDTEGMIEELIALDYTSDDASPPLTFRAGLPRTRGSK